MIKLPPWAHKPVRKHGKVIATINGWVHDRGNGRTEVLVAVKNLPARLVELQEQLEKAAEEVNVVTGATTITVDGGDSTDNKENENVGISDTGVSDVGGRDSTETNDETSEAEVENKDTSLSDITADNAGVVDSVASEENEEETPPVKLTRAEKSALTRAKNKAEKEAKAEKDA